MLSYEVVIIVLSYAPSQQPYTLACTSEHLHRVVCLHCAGMLQLGGGQLVHVQHNLIKRQKQHFTSLESAGVNIIFGVNGLVFVSPWSAKPPQPDPLALPATAQPPPAPPPASLEQRQAVCRAANAVRALAALHLPIYAEAVDRVVALATQEEIALAHMLREPFLTLVAGQETHQHSQTA